jgi:hypothetical protein
MTNRIFVARAINDDDGTWSVDAYLDQADAELRAQERLAEIVRETGAWTRDEDDDTVCWSPPDDWHGGSEVVIWKTRVDTRGEVKAGDDIWIIWIDWFDRETGVQMAYTTEAAAHAAAQATMDRMGGVFTSWVEAADDTVGWTVEEDGGIDREVIIWRRVVAP